MSDSEKKRPDRKATRSGTSSNLELRTWRDYYLTIRERLFLGAAIALLIPGIVGYLLLRQPPVYLSEASLLLDREGTRVVDMQQVVETGLDSSSQMWRVSLENHINQLKSRSFRNYVLESFTEEEKERILKAYQADEKPPSVAGILRKVLVEGVPNSFILRVQVRHRDPEAAALIANRYTRRYIDFNAERSQFGNEAAITFLREQEAELREKMRAAAQELQAYRQKHNLVSIEDDQNLIVQRLASINASLTAAQMERIRLESQLRQVENIQKNGGDLLEVLALSTSGNTPAILSDLDRLRRERQVMAERYGERHPQMVANQRAIEAAEALVQANIKSAIASLENQLSYAREHETDLLAELWKTEQESLQLDRVKIEFAALERAFETTRTTHTQLLDRINETLITSELENSAIRIFDHASIAKSPVQPNLKRIGMLVIFLGGFFFLGTPIGLAALDNKLKNAREVEDYLDQKLLGEISSVGRTKRPLRPHVVKQGEDDRAVEGFRGLFTQLQLASEIAGPKVLLATSTIPGEGKSFIVNNLSYCFASHGKRTLMIDFDLRRPSLHRFYSRLNNTGILQWLETEESATRDPTVEDLGIEEVAPNLFLLSSGGRTKCATEIIGNPAVERMIAALRKEFDVLVIDTPPLSVFADALPLSQLADESLYVVHFGKVDRHQVKGSLERLKETKARLLGVVMNSMPRGSRFSHHYSGYGFGNTEYARYYNRKA